eukprot:g3984.t1
MWGVRSVDGDEEAALARVEALTGSKSSLGGDARRARDGWTDLIGVELLLPTRVLGPCVSWVGSLAHRIPCARSKRPERATGDVPRLARARRRCTDRCCSVVLFAFLFGMWSVYQHALKEGNLAKLCLGVLHFPLSAVRDKPFLFWCTPNRNEAFTLLDGICVSQCPSSDREIFYCPGRALPFQVKQYLDAGVVLMLISNRWSCRFGLSKATSTAFTRVRFGYPSTEAFGYCFPTRDLAMLRSVTERTYVFGFTKQVVLAGSAQEPAMGYVFLFVIWYSFEKLVYSFLALAHVLLIGAAAGFLFVSFYPEHNFFQTYFSPEASRICAWGCAAISLILWMLFSILCCQGREALAVTIDSVTATCEVITEIPTMLLQPLVHSAFVVFTLLLLVYGFAWILSTGKVVPQLEPHRHDYMKMMNLEFSQLQWVCIVYWIFGAVWIFEILNALSQLGRPTSSGWSERRRHDCFGRLYHWLFEVGRGVFVLHPEPDAKHGGHTRSCGTSPMHLGSRSREPGDRFRCTSPTEIDLVKPCLKRTCLRGVLSMVNDLVYTDVALHSCGYIEAADNVVRVAASNPLTYAAIKASAITMRVVGVSIIGGCGTFLSYQALSSTELHRQLDLCHCLCAMTTASKNRSGRKAAEDGRPHVLCQSDSCKTIAESISETDHAQKRRAHLSGFVRGMMASGTVVKVASPPYSLTGQEFQDASTMLVTSNILGTTIAAGLICFYVGLAFMMVFYQTTYSLMYCMLLTGDGGQGEELKGREFQTRLPGEKMRKRPSEKDPNVNDLGYDRQMTARGIRVGSSP